MGGQMHLTCLQPHVAHFSGSTGWLVGLALALPVVLAAAFGFPGDTDAVASACGSSLMLSSEAPRSESARGMVSSTVKAPPGRGP